MLRGMTSPNNHLPVFAADLEYIAIQHPDKSVRHRRHQPLIVRCARLDLLQRGGIRHAVHGEVPGGAFTAGRAAAQSDRPQLGGHVIRERHPQWRIPLAAQPVGQADMVRVHVRHDHAQHGQAIKLCGKHLFPQGFDFVTADAAIDNRPALLAVNLVPQEPQVDVIQRERQGHANPPHPRRKLNGLSWLWHRIAMWVVQLVLVRIHLSVLHA